MDNAVMIAWERACKGANDNGKNIIKIKNSLDKINT